MENVSRVSDFLNQIKYTTAEKGETSWPSGGRTACHCHEILLISQAGEPCVANMGCSQGQEAVKKQARCRKQREAGRKWTKSRQEVSRKQTGSEQEEDRKWAGSGQVVGRKQAGWSGSLLPAQALQSPSSILPRPH